MKNLSFENKFNLHENKPVGGTHFLSEWFDTEAKSNSEMAYSQKTQDKYFGFHQVTEPSTA